jgi:hypothetical protein
MSTGLISRYPGVVPFSEDQADLFCGREKEKAELYNLVVAEQTVVLFAKSGVGKSSLLQAGLFPKLRKHGYHPIKVRFQFCTPFTNDGQEEKNFTRKTPLEILFETLEQRSQAEDDHVEIKREKILFNKENPRLWELIKVIELPDIPLVAEPVVQQTALAQSANEAHAGAAITDAEEDDEEVKKISSMLEQFIPFAEQSSTVKQTPVLVFDQFEEFFNFPETERNEFMMQLREVLHNLTPNRIGQWLRGFALSDRTPERLDWAKQPAVKCIISIRDDKLSELDSLRNYIPLILRNRYKLSALNKENAAEAMEKPALLPHKDRFRSPMFTFDTTVRDKIVERLTGADIDDRPAFSTTTSAYATKAAEQGIDGSQLQKVCTHIESKVIQVYGAQTAEPVEVNKKIIDPDIHVQRILDNFYQEQLNKIGGAKDIIRCRNVIEQHLVSGRSRASVTRSQMNDLLKGREYLLEKMISLRLIKEEYTHLGQTFELSHDSLVRSVAKYASENKLNILTRDKKRYTWAFIVAGVLFLIAFVLGLRIFALLNQNNLKLAESYYQQNNHYTAFNIWDKFRNRYMVSPSKKDSINKMLDSLSLFDIAGGDKLVRLSDWQMAVHEKDNTIHLWKIPGNGGRLQVKTITDAYNLETSHTKRYMGYRTKNGTLMVYDTQRDSSFKIPYADIAPMTGRRNPDVDADYKMAFVPGADFVGYIDTSGQVYIYDLDSRARIGLRIRKDADQNFYSGFLQSRMKISEDKKFVIIHKADSFTVWNIGSRDSLPVRQHSVKGITATYLFAKGNSYCYQKKDSLFIAPFDSLAQSNGNYARTYRTRILSTPSFSPDGRHCIFYNGNADLVIYNMIKATAEVIKDENYSENYSGNTYYSNSRRRMQSVYLTEPEWVDEGDKVYYQDKNGNSILFSVSQLRPIPDLSVYSPNGEYYCRLKLTGQLKVYNRRNGAVLFTDTIQTNSIKSMNVAFQYARFSSSGTLVAYQVTSGENQGYLKVVDFKTGAVRLRSRQLWSIGDFFTKDFIAVIDELGNPGLLFLNGRTRNKKYYQQLYPRLEQEEKDRLGVKDFRDIINIFKAI